MIDLLLVHVAGADGSKQSAATLLTKHENQEDVAPLWRLPDGSHARFVGVWVWHHGWRAKQYGLHLLAGNAVLAALGPVALVPVEANEPHVASIHICVDIGTMLENDRELKQDTNSVYLFPEFRKTSTTWLDGFGISPFAKPESCGVKIAWVACNKTTSFTSCFDAPSTKV